MRLTRSALFGRPGQRARRARLIALAAAILASLIAICFVAFALPARTTLASARPSSTLGQPAAVASDSPTSVRPTGTATEPADLGPEVSLGPDGVQSRSITAENARPGSPDWQITDPPATGYVQGWVNATSAQVGDTLTVYVSSTAVQYRVTAYRMGYYGGTGAREIWSSRTLDGHVQPPCPVVDPVKINMVSCANWSPSLTMPVTSDFVPGEYLLKFTGVGGEQSYAPLTIWNPESSATYLVESHDLTKAAWNEYGGFSFYTGTGSCPAGAPSYPVCNRARIASFDRPYLDGHGSGDFLYNEYPLLRYMEQHGLDVAYVSDVALDSQPDVMLRHRALLSLGHDETWTYAERTGAETAVAHGVNIAFFSAAAIVRHARLQPSSIGPDREVVEYRDPDEDPVRGDAKYTTGNTWAVPPTSWPVNSFVGQQYSGYLYPASPDAAFVVHDASAWIFNGTGLQNGSVIPGVIGSDIDHLDPSTTPTNLQVLGHSPIPLKDVLTNQGKWGNVTYSDMTYYTDPSSRAGIFDSGAVSWINALSRCEPTNCPATPVGQMTGNLLWLFGQGPAGDVVAPTPNWRQVTPAGS